MTREMLRRLARGFFISTIAGAAFLAAGLPGGPVPALASGDDAAGWPDAGGQALDPVSISATVDRSDVPSGGSLELTITIEMEHGWHINSNAPLEDWLIPTELVVDAPDSFSLTAVTYPDPEMMRFEFSDQDVAVYEGRAVVSAEVRLGAGLAEGPVALSGALLYQACNDQTCLPPNEKTFNFALTALAASGALQATGTPMAATDAEDKSVTARLSSSLADNFGNPFIAIILTLLAGLLSAATPCVYPMIPITARILMGRGGDSPALGRAHAFMYFLGIILVYMILGTIASITGGGFNEVMRIPVVILAIAIIFALLGLSMLGLFEIQIPESIASRVDSGTSKRSGLFGTVLMGAGAGLIVSPCVGPVVIFILTQIAASMAAAEAAGGGLSSSAKVVYGSFLMAGFGAGLGVPFLIVGLFSTKLAKPGPWMTAVRVALGLVILYFSYDYFHKSLATAGVERAFANAIVIGAVLVFLSVLWGVFRTKIEPGPHAGWHKVKHACTIIMLVTGIFFLWTGLSRSGVIPGGTSGVTLTAAPAGVAEDVEDSHGLLWQRDFAKAQEMARGRSLPIFVDFYAHWCANCKVFSHQAAEEGPLRDALESVVRAKIYDTDDVFKTFQNDPRYPELKRGLPFFLILSSDGEPLWKGTDYKTHDVMISQISRAIEAET